jgi:phosphopantetheine adenylyltransferase
LVKCPKTIYLKDSEKEKAEELTKMINDKRVQEGKKELHITYIMHEILEKGLTDNIKKLALNKSD